MPADEGANRMERVPYRDSTLTFLLKNGLGHKAVTHMLTCVGSESPME